MRSGWKRWLGVLLVVVMGLAAMPQPIMASSALSDIAGHWAEDAIHQAVQKGYVNGYPDGTFKPNNEVTRAEFIKMLVTAMNLPHSQGTSPWYQGFVAAAIEFGIHDESDFTDYNKPISRLEIMRVVARGLAQDTQYQTFLDAFAGLYNGDIPFVDYRDLLDIDIPYVALAFGTNIMNGYPDASIGLSKTATRAESVTMIESFLKARLSNPDRMSRLQELKEVAETGTNIKSVSNLSLEADIDPEEIVTEHARYTAKLKRLYVLPLEGDKTSIYERKFIWDRQLIPDHWIEGIKMKGLVVGLLDVTPKRDFDLNAQSFPTYLSPGADILYDEPLKQFGFKKRYVVNSEPRWVEKGKTYEVAIYGNYKDFGRIVREKSIMLQTNDAITGHGFPLISNPDMQVIQHE